MALCLRRARRSRLDEAPVVPLGEFPVDEQAEAFLEGERVDIGQGHLLGEGGSHTGAFQGLEFIQGRMCQHSTLLMWVSGSRMGHGCCRGPRARPPRSARRGVAGPGRGGGWIRDLLCTVAAQGEGALAGGLQPVCHRFCQGAGFKQLR